MFRRVYLREIAYEGVDWMQLVQGRGQWRSFL